MQWVSCTAGLHCTACTADVGQRNRARGPLSAVLLSAGQHQQRMWRAGSERAGRGTRLTRARWAPIAWALGATGSILNHTFCSYAPSLMASPSRFGCTSPSSLHLCHLVCVGLSQCVFHSHSYCCRPERSSQQPQQSVSPAAQQREEQQQQAAAPGEQQAAAAAAASEGGELELQLQHSGGGEAAAAEGEPEAEEGDDRQRRRSRYALLGLQVCRHTAGCAPCELAAEWRQPCVHFAVQQLVAAVQQVQVVVLSSRLVAPLRLCYRDRKEKRHKKERKEKREKKEKKEKRHKRDKKVGCSSSGSNIREQMSSVHGCWVPATKALVRSACMLLQLLCGACFAANRCWPLLHPPTGQVARPRAEAAAPQQRARGGRSQRAGRASSRAGCSGGAAGRQRGAAGREGAAAGGACIG